MVKTYDVNLVIDNGTNTIMYPCGKMSQSLIRKYLRRISKQKIIPETSCLYHVSAKFNANTMMNVFLTDEWPQTTFPTENHSGAIYVFIKLKCGCKCSKYECAHNIENGKCVDPFTVKILGNELFKEKYNKEKTKQR